jgi:hypothetical protein
MMMITMMIRTTRFYSTVDPRAHANAPFRRQFVMMVVEEPTRSDGEEKKYVRMCMHILRKRGNQLEDQKKMKRKEERKNKQ